MAKLSYEQVSEILNYDAETGNLFWKERPEHLFSDRGRGGRRAAASRWNKVYAGTEALASPKANGYLTGAIFGKQITAHRAAWLLATGDWPSGDIDHINGDPADNRFFNLRDGTTSENMQNQRRYKNNKSGHVGVSYRKRDGRWSAYINLNGCRKYLGEFRTLDEAISARRIANVEFGFSPRHGTSEAA